MSLPAASPARFQLIMGVDFDGSIEVDIHTFAGDADATQFLIDTVDRYTGRDLDGMALEAFVSVAQPGQTYTIKHDGRNVAVVVCLAETLWNATTSPSPLPESPMPSRPDTQSTTASATLIFGLRVLGRATVDEVEYVVYTDEAYTWAVEADVYDHVSLSEYAKRDASHYDALASEDDRRDTADEFNSQRYSLWCAEAGSGVGDDELCARIARAAQVEGIYTSGSARYAKALTTAQDIARRFPSRSVWNNDAGEHLPDLVGDNDHTEHRFGEAVVCEFTDGSAIAMTADLWDVVKLVGGVWHSVDSKGDININGIAFPVQADSDSEA